MTCKEIAIAFLQMASGGNAREAYERYVHPDFIHHNAWFKGDRETLLQGMEDNAREFPNKQIEVLRALEDGNLVAVHCKVALDTDRVFGLIHLFRFEGGLIAEVWEGAQEVMKDSPNEHGIF